MNVGVRLNPLLDKIDNGHFDYQDLCRLLDIHLSEYMHGFGESLEKALNQYIRSRVEMQDFAIAEQNLIAFCEHEGLPSPEALYGKDGTDTTDLNSVPTARFTVQMLSGGESNKTADNDNSIKMEELIKEAIPEIVKDETRIEFYTSESAKLERYFEGNLKLRNEQGLKKRTLAILDDLNQKGGHDLIFTSQAITPIKHGSVCSPVTYKDIKTGKGGSLTIGGTFSNEALDMQRLGELIESLKPLASPPAEKNTFQLKLPFHSKQ